MRARSSAFIFSALCTLIAFAVGACTAPPSVAPFADATVALRSAVVAVGDGATKQVEESGLADAAAKSRQIKDAMAARTAAMDALVAYAGGLREITSAAENSKATVGKIADGVTAVAGAAGIAMPAANVVGAAADAARFIFQQINNARAAASLQASLESADAALQKIASYLELDARSLDLIIVAAGNKTEDGIRDRSPELLPKAKAGTLSNRLDECEKALASIPAANLTALPAADLSKLATLTTLRDSLATQVNARNAELAAVRARTNADRALVHAMSDAIIAWSSVHSQLVKALQTRQPVSMDSLVDATIELRSIVNEVRQLKGK